MTPGIDRSALVNGVVTTLVLAIPLAFAAAWAGSRGDGSVALAANLAVLAIFVLGAGTAAWAQRNNTPIAHGLVTAGVAQLVMSALYIIIRVVQGGVINWFGQITLLGFALGCGVVGGVVGARLRQQGTIPKHEADRSGGQ